MNIKIIWKILSFWSILKSFENFPENFEVFRPVEIFLNTFFLTVMETVFRVPKPFSGSEALKRKWSCFEFHEFYSDFRTLWVI